MEAIKLCDLVEHQRYHYISAITGQAGDNYVWFENVVGPKNEVTKTYFFQFKSGETELCHPCSLSTFVKADTKKS